MDLGTKSDSYILKDVEKVYMEIAHSISKLSKCERKKVGCLIVKDKNILSFGYNGTPAGRENKCEDCNGNTKEEVLHAESNAILKCAREGVSVTDSEMYLTYSPCFSCSKLIVQSGIRRVFFSEFYRDVSGLQFLIDCGIKVIFIDKEKSFIYYEQTTE